MKRRDIYLITFVVIAVAVSAVLLSSGLSNLNVHKVSDNWNYQQLSLFNHSQSNFTFTYSGDERDDEGNFAKMINSINSNYPNILFNLNGGDLRSDATQLNNFKKDYLTPGLQPALINQLCLL
jgi:hypothetical protein